MTVEESYDGPRLKDDKVVTLEFLEQLMQHYKDQKKLHKRYAFQILSDILSYFKSQPSLVDIEVPETSKFTICGDIHGQFYDLLNIFKLNGQPSEENPTSLDTTVTVWMSYSKSLTIMSLSSPEKPESRSQ